MRRFSTGLCILALAGCGGDGAAARAVAVVDTVDGVERWSYPEAAAGNLGWSADTVGVLGDAFAEDEYQFAEVTWERLAGDAEGNLYILDRQGSRVLKYGPDGRHLATFGRNGEGPGELSQPLGLAVGRADTVWVTDFSNSRLTGFPQDGGAPRVAPYTDGAGVPSPAFAALDAGFIQSFRPMFNFRRGPGGTAMSRSGPGAEEGRPRIPLLRLSDGLAPVDTLWAIPEPPTDMVQLEMGDRMMVMLMARQFAPAFQWQALSDGTVVVSDTSAYLLRVIGPDGAVRRIIERAPAPRAVTEADREAARQRLRDQETQGTSIRMGGAGPDEATRLKMLEQRLEKMTFAAEIPSVISLRVDQRDRIWVGVAGEVPDSIGRIDIFDREGVLLGEVRDIPMPDVFLGDGRIGVLRTDEMDVQQVVLMRLREGPAAGE